MITEANNYLVLMAVAVLVVVAMCLEEEERRSRKWAYDRALLRVSGGVIGAVVVVLVLWVMSL